MNLIRKSCTHSQILNRDAIVQPYYHKRLKNEHNWPLFFVLISVQEGNVENQTVTWKQREQGKVNQKNAVVFHILKG